MVEDAKRYGRHTGGAIARPHWIKGILAAGCLSSLVVFAAVGGALSGVSRAAEIDTGPRLYVLDCGVLLYNSWARFGLRPAPGAPTNLSDACYLIDDAKRGSLIWDTGVVPDRQWAADGIPPKKEYAEATRPLATQLAEIGHKPEDVTYAAVSHSHWDHVANLYLFSKSTWLADRYTRDLLLSDKPGERMDPSMFSSLAATPTKVLPSSSDYDVFGDGQVTIVTAPGHTPDSRVLVVKLRRHRPVILCGDLYHFRQEVGLKGNLHGDNPDQLAASRAKIEILARQLGAEIWIGHDYREFSRLRRAPAYYD